MEFTKVKSPQELLSFVGKCFQDEGMDKKQYDLDACIEMKKEQGAMETKANEVVHTGNTGAGAELVPGSIQTTDFLDLIPRISGLLGAFTGFHGRNLDKIQEVPVIGELPFHDLGTEWTTGAGALSQGKGKQPTAKITLTQKKYEFSVDISDEQVRFVNIVDMVALIQRKLALSAARTQEALAVNGDVVTAATGNVNSDNAAPALTKYYLGADGIRKAALANGADVGALTFDDFLTVLGNLSDNYSSPEEVIWMFNHSTYTKALGVDEFKDYAKNGKASTIHTGALSNVLGSDVFVPRDFGKTEADGKIHTTAGNNTKGGFVAVHKGFVQYGYSGEYQIEIARVTGKGFQIFGHYFMAQNTADNATGDSDIVAELGKMVAGGYNVTL
jgi:hypothetical protein